MLRSSEPNGCASPNNALHWHEVELRDSCAPPVYSGKLRPKRLTSSPDAVVQLDRRRQSLVIEAGAAPHRERAGREGRRIRRIGRRGHEAGQPRVGIDLVARLERQRLEVPQVILRLDAVLRADQPARRPLGQEVDRRVEQQRRHQEGDEQREDARDRRRMAIPDDDPAAGDARRARTRRTRPAGRLAPAACPARSEAATAIAVGRTQAVTSSARVLQRRHGTRQPDGAAAITSVAAQTAASSTASSPPSSAERVVFHGCSEKCRRSIVEASTIASNDALARSRISAATTPAPSCQSDPPGVRVRRIAARARNCRRSRATAAAHSAASAGGRHAAEHHRARHARRRAAGDDERGPQHQRGDQEQGRGRQRADDERPRIAGRGAPIEQRADQQAAGDRDARQQLAGDHRPPRPRAS